MIISQTLNTNTLSGYTTEHEYLLIGAIPNQTNTITVTLTNKQGKVVDTLSWSYNAPSLQGGDQYLTVECDDSNTSSYLTVFILFLETMLLKIVKNKLI